jgi:hypothetical protein
MYLQSLNTFLNKSNGNGTRNTSVRDNNYYRDNHHNISAQDILYAKRILLSMNYNLN